MRNICRFLRLLWRDLWPKIPDPETSAKREKVAVINVTRRLSQGNASLSAGRVCTKEDLRRRREELARWSF